MEDDQEIEAESAYFHVMRNGCSTKGMRMNVMSRRGVLFLIMVTWVCSFTVRSQQATWRLASSTAGLFTLDVEIFCRNPDTLYAFADSMGPTLLLSTDRGETWSKISRRRWDSWIGTAALQVDAFDPRRIYESYFRRYPFQWGDAITDMTTDGGQTWSTISSLVDWDRFSSVAQIHPLNNHKVYLGSARGRINYSSNRGATWGEIAVLPDSESSTGLTICQRDTNLFFASSYAHVYKSSDGGLSWNQVRSTSASCNGVLFDPRSDSTLYITHLLSGANGGPWKSSDLSISWYQIRNGLSSNPFYIYGIAINPKNRLELYLFGSRGNPCYRSTNGGMEWARFDTGLPQNIECRSIAIDTINNRLYAATSAGIYINALSTNITERKISHPQRITLYQNYPNPFNPTTEIRYQISEVGRVTLKVFDVLGREVATLVNEVKEPGMYELQFDASNLSSGVYFYRLNAGIFSQTRKLVLLR